MHKCPGGGIGRRAGFKIQFHWSAGSIPALGTQVDASSLRVSLNLNYRKIVEVFLFNRWQLYIYFFQKN